MSFQFHNGTIKTFDGTNYTHCIVEFQFHNGTIKTNDFVNGTFAVIVFQFHNGTIKTGSGRFLCENDRILFQFHNGTIKTCDRHHAFAFLYISIP